MIKSFPLMRIKLFNPSSFKSFWIEGCSSFGKEAYFAGLGSKVCQCKMFCLALRQIAILSADHQLNVFTEHPDHSPPLNILKRKIMCSVQIEQIE